MPPLTENGAIVFSQGCMSHSFKALSGNLVTKISDHFPQFLIIEDLKVNYASLNYYKHDYSHFSEETFVDEVSHLDFPSIYNCNLNTNGKFESIKNSRYLTKSETFLSTNMFLSCFITLLSILSSLMASMSGV